MAYGSILNWGSCGNHFRIQCACLYYGQKHVLNLHMHVTTTIRNFQTRMHGYIFRIFQHFATKLCTSSTNFSVLFQAVGIYFLLVAKIKHQFKVQVVERDRRTMSSIGISKPKLSLGPTCLQIEMYIVNQLRNVNYIHLHADLSTKRYGISCK